MFSGESVLQLDDRMIEKVRNAFQRAEKRLQEKGLKQVKYTEFFIDSHKESGDLDNQQHHEPTVAFLQGLLNITEKETWSFKIFAVPVPDWDVVSAALNKMFNYGVTEEMIDTFASAQLEYKDVKMTGIIYSLPQRRFEFPLTKSTCSIITAKTETSLPFPHLLVIQAGENKPVSFINYMAALPSDYDRELVYNAILQEMRRQVGK